MKTYKEFLRAELKKAGHKVAAGMDYLDIVLDEVESAAVLYSEQNRKAALKEVLEYISEEEWNVNAFQIEHKIESLID